MIRCKRSERVASLLPLVLLALGGLAGCASSVPVAVAALEPVAVAESASELRGGVNDQPLAPGESLAFDLGKSLPMTWTMRGVSYPLELRAYLDDGSVVGPWLMDRCSSAVRCEVFDPGVSARWWVETRPG